MSFSYISTVMGGEKKFRKFIIDGFEKTRLKKKISVETIDQWLLPDCPLYSECLKDNKQMTKWAFSVIAMGLECCVDILFKPILAKPTISILKKITVYMKENGIAVSMQSIKKSYELVAIIGSIEELGE